jgi:WD40 repeat protein
VLDSRGKKLLSSSFDQTAIVWSGEPSFTHDIPDRFIRAVRFTGHSSWVNSIAVAADAKTAFTASSDETVKHWNLLTGEELHSYAGHGCDVWTVAAVPGRQQILSGGHDRNLILWNVNDARSFKVLRGHQHTVLSVTASDGGRYAFSGSDDGALRLWDLDSGKALANLKGHASSIRCVVFRESDGTAVTASTDHTIRIWGHGRQLAILERHTAPVGALSLTADGSLLASASFDGSVRVWRCDTWEQVASIRVNTRRFPVGLAFNPCGPILATVGHDGTTIDHWKFDADALLRRKTSQPDSHYSNAKILIVGNSGTGKTCLARALMGEPFEPQESTHGMKVWHFHSQTVNADRGQTLEREILLWDLAGQPEYHIVHQLFLDQSALALVLFDPSDAHNPFGGAEYWIRVLRKAAGDNCPQLFVAARTDRGHPTATARDIEAFCRQHALTGYVATSARTGAGVSELKELIAQHVPWDGLPITSSSQLWRNLRAYLLKRRAGEDLLARRTDLMESFIHTQQQGASISRDEFDAVIGHAQAQGLVWRLSFGDFVLLKPELLNDYSAAMVRAARKHPDGLGSVPERDLLDGRLDFQDMERCRDEGTERSVLHAVVELCIERQVAMRESGQIVFPSKFNRRRPEHLGSATREVAYVFSGPVEQIYATLNVRLYYSGAFTLKDLYRDAAEFHDPLGRVCGIVLEVAQEGTGRLCVFFEKDTSIDSRVLFLRFTHEHLLSHVLLGTLIRERIYRCPSCAEEADSRKAIQARLAQGKQTIACQYCDSDIPLVDLLEEKLADSKLLRRVRQMEAEVETNKSEAVSKTTLDAKRAIGEFDVFLCHNLADKPQVRQLDVALQKYGIRTWLDERDLRPGLPWQRGLEEQIGKIHSAAVVIGASGLGPWQELEMEALLREFARRRLPVIPVLLQTAPREPALPLFLRGMAWVNFQNQATDPMASLVYGITGARPQAESVQRQVSAAQG